MTPGVASQSTMPQGPWGPRLSFANVPIHSHVVADGKVRMWGRRDTTNLDHPVCSPFVWDPADPTESTGPTTARADGTIVDLFCVRQRGESTQTAGLPGGKRVRADRRGRQEEPSRAPIHGDRPLEQKPSDYVLHVRQFSS
jgi:hypothetical protein